MQPTTLHAEKRAKQQGYTPERLLAFSMVEAERNRQVEKFGNSGNPTATWLAILMEEHGEVGTAILNHDVENLKEELTQVAAVALSWLEDLL